MKLLRRKYRSGIF